MWILVYVNIEVNDSILWHYRNVFLGGMYQRKMVELGIPQIHRVKYLGFVLKEGKGNQGSRVDVAMCTNHLNQFLDTIGWIGSLYLYEWDINDMDSLFDFKRVLPTARSTIHSNWFWSFLGYPRRLLPILAALSKRQISINRVFQMLNYIGGPIVRTIQKTAIICILCQPHGSLQ